MIKTKKVYDRDSIELNFNVPIMETTNSKGLSAEEFLNNDFFIEGIAINATTTSNNHKFLAEELEKSAEGLNGVPLLVDHRNEVDAIKGRVVNSYFDNVNNNVRFKAKIMDDTIKQMIRDGRLNSVSIGATVNNLEEEDDALIPRGIEFKELSVVAVPADSQATFSVALMEAYKSKSLKLKGGLDNMENTEKIAEEEQTPKVKEEVTEEKVEEKTEEKDSEMKNLLKSLVEKMTIMDKSINELKDEVAVIKQAEEEKEEAPAEEEKPVVEPKKEPEAEKEEDNSEDEAEEKGSYKVFELEEGGSLKGGAFTYKIV